MRPVIQKANVAAAMQVLVDALEVWDYSRYNIQGYARRVAEAQPRLQYLPFPFLSTKSDVALGADPLISQQFELSMISILCHKDYIHVDCQAHKLGCANSFITQCAYTRLWGR